jgi:hypothetical protein
MTRFWHTIELLCGLALHALYPIGEAVDKAERRIMRLDWEVQRRAAGDDKAIPF